MEPKSKILLIDDEEVVLDSCTQILAGGPYQVATASDGTAGLRLVEEFHPDLDTDSADLPRDANPPGMPHSLGS